jgi:hypothetical protein
MRQGRHEALAVGLGWFSIALGLAELLAPHAMARATGLKGRERLLQAYGAREIAAGVALLLMRNKAPGLWARVAGDAVDLATLASARNSKAGPAIAAVAGVTALDAWSAASAQRAARRRPLPAADYSHRSGFPRPAEQMRGAARREKHKSGSEPEFQLRV